MTQGREGIGRTAIAGQPVQRAGRLAVGAGIVMLLLALNVGVASAWGATPTGSFGCVTTADGVAVGLNWSTTSWAPGELRGENASIVVEMSRDFGPWEKLGVGAFTAASPTFSGMTVLPAGTGHVMIRTYAAGPWGDGTIDNQSQTIKIAVPTVTDLGCAVPVPVAPTVEQPTTPPPPDVPGVLGVQSTPTPAPQPTPTEEASAPEPSPTAVPEVRGVQQLAQTGTETPLFVIVGIGLLAAGAMVLAGVRPVRGRH